MGSCKLLIAAEVCTNIEHIPQVIYGKIMRYEILSEAMITEQYHCLWSVHVGRMVFIFSLQKEKGKLYKKKRNFDTHDKA